MNLEQRYKNANEEVTLRLKGFDLNKVNSQAVIEYVLKNAVMYKYQKVLMMVELTGKTTDGDYQ